MSARYASPFPGQVLRFYWSILPLRQRAVFLLAAIPLLIGVTGLPAALFGPEGAAVSLVLVAAALYRFHHAYVRANSTLIGKPSDEVEELIQRLKPSAAEESEGYVVDYPAYKSDGIVASDRVDSRLRNAHDSISVCFDAATVRRIKRRLSPRAGFYKDVLLALHAEARKRPRGIFSDDEKLSLMTTLTPQTERVRLAVSSYFMGCVTNDLCEFDYLDTTHEASPTRVWSALSNYPYDKGRPCRLDELPDSGNSNHIGVSCIAVSKDKKLVLWMQSQRAAQSRQRIAPTGSGSLDAGDVVDIGSGETTFVPTVLNGMKRELLQECHKLGQAPHDIVADGGLRLLGYCRWLKRGGKPEFLGICRLKSNAAQIQPNVAEVHKLTKNAYVLDASNLSRLRSSAVGLLDSRAISIPLFANLRSLLSTIDEEPEYLDFLELE